MHISAQHGLKEDEKYNTYHVSLRKEVDGKIRDRFGPDISPDDFTYVNHEDTPIYDMYEDNTTDTEGGLAGNNEYNENPITYTGLDYELPAPEANANYINTSVMLLRGRNYAIGKVF